MNLALCSYIHYLEIWAATNRPKKAVFCSWVVSWLVCLQSFICFKPFQCRNARFLRLGILIIIIIIKSFIIFNELQMARILLMLMLLPQVSLSVKGKQIMSSPNWSSRGFIQFVRAYSRSMHSYCIPYYYYLGGTIKLWVSSLWNVFLYMTSAFLFKWSEHFCISDLIKERFSALVALMPHI